MTVDLAKRRALLAAATPGSWESKIDLLDEDDGLAFTVTDATYKMLGILPTEFPNTPAGSASALKHPASANAVLIVGLVNEETEILDELESLRKWCKASIDADQVLCSENERLRRFRDAVMEFASVTSIGNACWSKRSFEVFPTLEACIADERAALAKESGNGV